MVARAWMGFGAPSVFTLAILAFGLAAVPQQASALDCSARPAGGGGTWVYRTVEGKKCWYRGTQVISKSELHWKVAAKPEVLNAQASFNNQASIVPVALRENAVLPSSSNDDRHPDLLGLAQGDTFESRWRGLPR